MNDKRIFLLTNVILIIIGIAFYFVFKPGINNNIENNIQKNPLKNRIIKFQQRRKFPSKIYYNSYSRRRNIHFNASSRSFSLRGCH